MIVFGLLRSGKDGARGHGGIFVGAAECVAARFSEGHSSASRALGCSSSADRDATQMGRRIGRRLDAQPLQFKMMLGFGAPRRVTVPDAHVVRACQRLILQRSGVWRGARRLGCSVCLGRVERTGNVGDWAWLGQSGVPKRLPSLAWPSRVHSAAIDAMRCGPQAALFAGGGFVCFRGRARTPPLFMLSR